MIMGIPPVGALLLLLESCPELMLLLFNQQKLRFSSTHARTQTSWNIGLEYFSTVLISS
jgi:hypothetical protein